VRRQKSIVEKKSNLVPSDEREFFGARYATARGLNAWFVL